MRKIREREKERGSDIYIYITIQYTHHAHTITRNNTYPSFFLLLVVFYRENVCA
jgi:hypothetical protein